MNLKEFVNPAKQYRPTPVWSWNSVIEAADVETRVRELKRKGFGGFFIRSRSGLRTHYLGDDWMRAVRRAVETARESEIECWLTDEDTGRSGYAGGVLSSQNPDFSAMTLTWYSDATLLDSDDLATAVAFTRDNETHTERPDNLQGYGVFVERRLERGEQSFNGEQYGDLLNPSVTETFINETHEKYSKLFRYDFGEYMPGILSIDPTVDRTSEFPAGVGDDGVSFPWSSGMSDFFRDIHGYSPIDRLHLLIGNDEKAFEFRHDFSIAVNERFITSFSASIGSWCREHDFMYAGADTNLNPSHQEYRQIPGSILLGNCPFDPIPAKQASSVASQMDRKRVFGFLYSGAGNELTYEDMKRLADYHCAMGITNVCPDSLSHSLLGDRKRDFPPSISYHQPYWEHLRVITDYIARISWSVSSGKSTANVLVISPSTSLESLRIGNSGDSDAATTIENSYRSILEELSGAHIQFDCGDERIIRRHGSSDGDTLTVGAASYRAVILPPSLSWRTSTIELLSSFNGPVILLGDIPKRVEGVLANGCKDLSKKKNVVLLPDEPFRCVKTLDEKLGRRLSITDADGNEAKSVIVNHRVDAGTNLLFLVNRDSDNACDVTIDVEALGGVVELDALTGRAFRYASRLENGRTIIDTTLHPSGSRVFLIDQTQTSSILVPPESSEETLVISGPYSFTKNQDNSLVLDRCKLVMDGKTLLKKASPVESKKIVQQKTGIDEYAGYQPWVMEQRNVRTRTNTTELTFRFNVTDVPESISLAMESADKFTVLINGDAVEPTPGKWHLDKRIHVLDIEDKVVQGENTITATTDYLWDTEIENIYLFGDFAVGLEADGFPIINEPATIDTGSWTEQGYPFYSGTMTYTMEFDLEFGESEFFELDCSGARSSNLFVTVNGTEIGSLPFHPYRAEITAALQQGKNSIDIEIIGTLRNILGPFHNEKTEGNTIVSPDSYSSQCDSQNAYTLESYGFIEPPKLIRIIEGVQTDTTHKNSEEQV